MGTKFEAGSFAEKTNKYYGDLSKIYMDFDKLETAKKLDNTFQEVVSKDKICLAFVGQYSAGKSTIIKALTGDSSILIDSDIATSSVKHYNWGSVVLIDTPGLNTNENKEHDEMTLEAISKSDLLIYCITSDLFREVTKKDFKKLASEYKSKLFLVVNKMSKETGEYDVLVENYSDTINKTIAPEYNLVDFHHFFVDAADYLEGLEDDDPDFIKDSHFEGFIEKLNFFIKLKGLNGKALTPVSLLIQSIDDTLIDIEDDEHNKEAMKIIQRICNIVEDKKKNFVRVSRDEVQKLAHKFIQKGDEVAAQLGEKSFEFTDDDLQEFAEPLQDKVCKTITEYFEKYAKETDEEVNRVLSSELALHYFEEEKKLKLEKSIKGNGNGAGKFEKIEQGLGDVTTKVAPKISNFMIKFSNVAAGEKASIWTVKGSDLHKTVLSIGHKFGHKFKPFEALKVSKKIANLSKWLGPILTGAGTFVEVLGWIAEKSAEKKLEKARISTKALFSGMSEETEQHYSSLIEEAASEFDNIKNKLQTEIQKINENSETNKDFRTRLSLLKSNLCKLQHDIEYSSNM